jgi:hypothetical protein
MSIDGMEITAYSNLIGLGKIIVPIENNFGSIANIKSLFSSNIP